MKTKSKNPLFINFIFLPKGSTTATRATVKGGLGR